MVAESIEIFTKSYRSDAPAVHWVSDGESTYTIEECEKENRGTKIVMHIAEAEKEFLEQAKVRALLEKYCAFMPYDIYLDAEGKEEDKPVNDTQPLYLKNPKDCTEEEYLAFYRKVFHDYHDPLFWIHLNMDYPFRLKGILYFPKVKSKVELERGKVKLYCNQVFIADNIKEVIPEYLLLLNGVIDCPDIPLNVSRSFLQNDRQVQKISKHIVKKVSDKLTGLYKTDREKYIKSWADISVFIKVGCLKDEDFYTKVKDIFIFRDLNGEYKNLEEFREAVSPKEEAPQEVKEGEEKSAEKPVTVYYVSDEVGQAQYVSMFRNAGLNAIVCDSFVDPHYISYIEYKESGKFRFLRIDADVDAAMKDTAITDEEADKKLVEDFKAALGVENVSVRAEKLKSDGVPAIINVSEYARRFGEMNAFYGLEGADADRDMTLVLNTANKVVQAFSALDDGGKQFVAKQIYLLAKLSYKKLSSEEMREFLDNSVDLLRKYTDR